MLFRNPRQVPSELWCLGGRPAEARRGRSIGLQRTIRKRDQGLWPQFLFTIRRKPTSLSHALGSTAFQNLISIPLTAARKRICGGLGERSRADPDSRVAICQMSGKPA